MDPTTQRSDRPPSARRAASGILLVLLAGGPGCMVPGRARDPAQEAWRPASETVDVTVREILRHPWSYVGREVVVAGGFGGLADPARDPFPGSSCWLLQEGARGVPVAGPAPSGCLPPKRGFGRPLVLVARVRVSERGLLYLTPSTGEVGAPAR